MPKVWSITSLRRRRAVRAAGHRERGFSPVEILLAATVFGFMVTALVGAIVYGREGTAESGDRVRALTVAEEGLEAARNIRDAAFSNLTNGTFGLVQSGNIWTLSGSSDVSGGFTRSVTIATVDSTRKSITTTVTWNSGASSVTLGTRLTNWIAAIPSWLAAIQAGGVDASGTQDGYKVATVGNYAYLVRNTGTPNFLVYDLTNLASPSLVGSLTLAGNPTNIAVSGNFAYVSNSSDTAEMQIVNITTPASPTLAGTYNATGTGDGTGVGLRGTTAFLARNNDTTTNAFEITLVNVTTPASPTTIGGYNAAQNTGGIYVPAAGNYVYLGTASNTAEVMVINITTPASPTLAASLDMSGTNDTTTMTGYGNTLLVGQGPVLRSVNITTPTSPAVLGSVTPTGSGTVNDVVVDATNTYAFIGTTGTTAEFQVITITTPASMTVARVVDIAGTTSTLSGVAYNTSLDVVAGASALDTQELVTFRKN